MEISGQNIENIKLNFIDSIILLLKWKKFILISSLIVTIVAIVMYFFVLDLIYYSTATVKSSGKNLSMLMNLGGLGDIGGIGDLVGGSSASKELAYYMEILSSRRSLEPLINKFELMQRDDQKYMEDAIKSFKDDKLVLDFDKLSGILTIGVYDKDPKMAKEMVEYLIEELNIINIELSVLNAKNNREFIEKRYFLAKLDLANAEDSLKRFQFNYGIAPDLQVKAATQSLFTLEAELKTEEVKLDVLKKILNSEQPEVKLQEEKINSIRNKILEIQTSTSHDLLSLGNSPKIVMDFIRLQREIEIQTKILTFILPLYEQAKIEEKKDTPTILVLDKPYIAERKTKPKRLTMVIVISIMSIIFFSLNAIIYEIYIKRFISIIKTAK